MLNVTSSIGKLLIIDAALIMLCILALIPLSRYKHAAYAVLRRNFLGYFSNPSGYVFLCLFVMAASAAAFWPSGFFADNLATLDQLNQTLPFILLMFIPTITMGIWAEERKQGTDELLLTIPADDWDIVLGKYLAAAAIFSVSLIFSQIANFVVLTSLALGDVDVGLFMTTYVGYWSIGLAMISLGMVASFLTNNMTVGFILGVVLNAPFVFSQAADVVMASRLAENIAWLSYGDQFRDFGRGVISLRSLIYFGMSIAAGLYLSVVLIGRRHWWGGKDGQSLLGHYLVRTIALIATAFSLCYIFAHQGDIRYDATFGQVSSLSRETRRLLDRLNTPHTIRVEAFISRQLPQDYVQTKLDLLSMLHEFQARGGKKVDVLVYDDLETSSDQAARAEEQHGIRPVPVFLQERGVFKQEDVFLAAVFTCGLEKVVVPFFDRDIPVEYELVRSIVTVAQPQRKRLGIVNTDAQLFGGFDFQRMTQRPKELIVEELEKQYDVVQIDPSNPIQEDLDVLVAVQPSSLTQPQLDNLIDAIRKGIPTAVFEDPYPVMINAPGTSQPKMPRGGPMGFGGAPPEPKGDIRGLWTLLGLEMVGRDQFGQFSTDVVWQEYNPYKRITGLQQQFTDEWVFVTPDAPGAEKPFNPDVPITKGLGEVLFPYPGGLENLKAQGLTFTPLVQTGTQVGTINSDDLQSVMQIRRNPLELELKRRDSTSPFVLAARIQGTIKKELAMAPENGDPTDESRAASDTANSPNAASSPEAQAAGPASPSSDNAQANDQQDTEADSGEAATKSPPDTAKPAASAPEQKIDVVYVADIDLLHSDFFRVRARRDGEIKWDFDNVTFVLNVVDALGVDKDDAQDPRNSFIEIRKRKIRHGTLSLIEQQTAKAREDAAVRIQRFNQEFQNAEADAKAAQEKALNDLQKKVDELNKKNQEGGQDVNRPDFIRALNEAVQNLAVKQHVEQRKLDTLLEGKRRELNRNLERIDRELRSQVKSIQDWYKALAFVLPSLPPLIIGLSVFLQRRARERESITAERKR